MDTLLAAPHAAVAHASLLAYCGTHQDAHKQVCFSKDNIMLSFAHLYCFAIRGSVEIPTQQHCRWHATTAAGTAAALRCRLLLQLQQLLPLLHVLQLLQQLARLHSTKPQHVPPCETSTQKANAQATHHVVATTANSCVRSTQQAQACAQVLLLQCPPGAPVSAHCPRPPLLSGASLPPAASAPTACRAAALSQSPALLAAHPSMQSSVLQAQQREYT